MISEPHTFIETQAFRAYIRQQELRVTVVQRRQTLRVPLANPDAVVLPAFGSKPCWTRDFMGCIEEVTKVVPNLTNANFTLARTPARLN